MRLRFDAILFDLDGTLVDSFDDIAHSLRIAFEHVGHPVELADARACVDGSPLEEVFSSRAPLASRDHYPRFASAYRAAYRESNHARSKVYEGILHLLERLHGLPVRPKLAVATSKPTHVAEHMATQFRLHHYFDLLAGSGDQNIRHKPAPDLLLQVAKALAVEPTRTIMIGDTARDVLAGRSARMHTVAVTWGAASRESLRDAGAHHVVDDVESIWPLLVEESPSESSSS